MADSSGDHIIPPYVLWAQRKDKLYVTIDLSDVSDEEIKLDEKSLYFKGKGGPDRSLYEVTINFHDEVKPSESKQNKTGRQLVFSIVKKEEGPYWPRLLSGKQKPHWLKIDFNKWRDEDDSDVEEDKDMQFEDMMSQMGNFNTGAEAEDERESEDSDDEDLPDLE